MLKSCTWALCLYLIFLHNINILWAVSGFSSVLDFKNRAEKDISYNSEICIKPGLLFFSLARWLEMTGWQRATYTLASCKRAPGVIQSKVQAYFPTRVPQILHTATHKKIMLACGYMWVYAGTCVNTCMRMDLWH